MRKKMGNIFLPMLLAVSLICGTAGCGKSEDVSGEATGGDAVDLAGMLGGGDAVDLTGTSGGGDAVDLTGTSGGSVEGRQVVDGDSVTVKIPTISYEDFGNGFYDEYVVDYEPLLERTYDEDGLLTGARIIFDDIHPALDPSDARITLSYEKRDGMVTGCELSADMYGWYKVCNQDYTAYGGSRLLVTEDEAKENNEKAQRKMPYRIAFREPTAAEPDVVKEAVIAAIDGYEEQLHGAILPNVDALDFCEAFKMMYLEAFSPFSDTGQMGAGGSGTSDGDGSNIVCEVNGYTIFYDEESNTFYDKSGFHMSYDEDWLLTSLSRSGELETGGTAEWWITFGYEKESGLVTACEIDADLYGLYLYEGYDEESAKELNEYVKSMMPLRLVADEPVEPEPELVWNDIVTIKLGETPDDYGSGYGYEIADIYYVFGVDIVYGICGMQNPQEPQEAAEQVDIGPRIRDRFRKRMDGSGLAGSIGGEMVISNDPGWVIGMENVSHEEIICQIETEQDSAGNITLVHRYNNYASYDHVFTYDSAGRMIQCDYYEYSNGQSREAVGVNYSTTYSYDGAGHLVKIENLGTQANRVDSAVEYTYDDMGRMVTQKSTSGYYGTDFMTAQQECNSIVRSYEYDNAGKVILMSYTVEWAKTAFHPEPPAPTTVMYRPAQ